MCVGRGGLYFGKRGHSGLFAAVGSGFVCLGHIALAMALGQKECGMSNTVFLIALACMSAITFVLRAAPTLLPRKWLESPWLNALNFALPLSVMMVLILAALPLQEAVLEQNWRELAAQILALLLVLMVYVRWRNVLVAMVTGVGILNLLLYLFG